MSAHDPSSLETAEDAEPPAHPPFRIRRWHVGVGFCVLLAAALVVASLISIPYYALTPGTAQSVAPLIVVPKSLSHAHKGSVMLVDVELTPMRAIQWIYYELDPSATVVKSSSLLGPETPAQYNTEGVLDMSDAQQAAVVVALRELGFDVKATPTGALLYALQPGSPAGTSLTVGDVVTSVDGSAVHTTGDLTGVLSGRQPGESISIGLTSYPHRMHEVVRVRLGAWHWKGPPSQGQLDCVPTGTPTPESIALLVDQGGQLAVPSKTEKGRPVACLGVLYTETAYRTGALPVKINLASEGIVGPSAGLAFTLGLIEKLDTADLTGGNRVAATGTMSITGQIGAIGGIQQKTIAVRNAGVGIFLVPTANYADAKKYAGSQLKVFAVATISQAISVLHRYGGTLVPPALGSH